MTRTRREISAGCVIYRRRAKRVDVALIRPKGKGVWALPKGQLDPGESPAEAAAREAGEETGLTGSIGDRIETIKYTYTAKWEEPPARVFKIVTFFLMEARGGSTADHDWEVDEVGWFTMEDAISRAAYRSERQVLERAREMLGEAEDRGRIS